MYGDSRLPERFWDKVQPEPNTGCWLWTASLGTAGYGQYGVGYKKHLSHRVAFQAIAGPVPPGLHLDHLCRNRTCVNPAHLEPVTCGENLRRSPFTKAKAQRAAVKAGEIQSAKTHCPAGHPYDDANTYRYRTRRCCRACNREAQRGRA